ncbi:MAG: hypothetical protein KDA61_18945, partial [Planctomycetales bacterium]|nr:hypothetical protein [Planctomycetales bacterium]
VRLAENPALPLRGRVIRVETAASARVEPSALTQAGGGEIAVRHETNEPVASQFRLLVRMDVEDDPGVRHGMKAYVQLSGARPTWGRLIYRRGLNLLAKLQLPG